MVVMMMMGLKMAARLGGHSFAAITEV